jgi:hypothetical protein
MPELYLLIVILLPEDFIHHEDREGHEERTTERASNLKNAFFLRALRVLRGRIHFPKTSSCTQDFIGSRSPDSIFQPLCAGGLHIWCTGAES